SADNLSGLNYIKYYEDDNEPDYTWYSPRWTAENYAKYCNAVHDGFGVTPDAEHPLLGIKSVDPDAKHVMAGMASTDTIYVNKVLKASNGRVPFDVLNVHCYTTDMSNAYSPEHERYGYEYVYRNYFKWKNRVLPDLPVWITEFGWDTYLAPDNRHSYTYAPAPQQANYILRAYMILMKMGFEKAFLFMDTDTDSKGLTQYATSGLLSDKATKYIKKPSYYYLATMQHVLGKTEYSKAVSYKEVSGANEVYCLEFIDPLTSDKVFALWTRATGSKTDNGAKTVWKLNPGYKVNGAYSIVPVDKDMDGDTIISTITENAIELNLSETPQFVVVPANATSSELHPSESFKVKVYPNPGQKEVQVSIVVPQRQKVTLSAYTSEGRLVKTMVNGLMEQGIHHYHFGSGHMPGTYFLSFNTDSEKIVRKVILLD
ncbi:MAG TPA: T9SS type A sorting domain-containing protein, partial [Prolixibacteraceae bacterium]|nr:T9SS type A sorting domain-containing protein [Prolixibacteraceae bacterium]